MTNQQHPIILPPELVDQWHVEALKGFRTNGIYEQDIATQAARWGAAQELEACCEWLAHEGHEHEHLALRAARRPKPPSLKEQALDAWDRLRNEAWCEEIDFDLDFVRRALEALPE
jgi:hypothetical protein